MQIDDQTLSVGFLTSVSRLRWSPNQLSHIEMSQLNRVIFSDCQKYSGVALIILPLVLWLVQKTCTTLKQSNAKLKPITTYSPASFHALALIFLWVMIGFFEIFSWCLIGRRDCIGLSLLLHWLKAWFTLSTDWVFWYIFLISDWRSWLLWFQFYDNRKVLWSNYFGLVVQNLSTIWGYFVMFTIAHWRAFHFTHSIVVWIY